MPGPLGDSMAENPMGLIDEIDGFPVRTIDFIDGAISAETTLSTVEDRDLDPALFAVPEGYTQQNPRRLLVARGLPYNPARTRCCAFWHTATRSLVEKPRVGVFCCK